MLKLISFDVGIKNLAYCIIESNTDKTILPNYNFNVLDWDIINLLETDNNNKCCAPIYNSKCDEKVKYYVKKNDKILGYICQKHLSYNN
jgi:hypothetical protein